VRSLPRGDFCVRCHQHAEPVSHRGGWGEPLNRHCINCHYPARTAAAPNATRTSSIPKRWPQPHVIGLYGNCGLCHPGGVPYRAPHIMNTSIKCLACH